MAKNEQYNYDDNPNIHDRNSIWLTVGLRHECSRLSPATGYELSHYSLYTTKNSRFHSAAV